MNESLVISVRLHEGWYHGAGSVPSPARLFQALIAGCGIRGPLPHRSIKALQWLEQQPPPVVATPSTKSGQTVVNYVPNNDLDSKQGDPRRIGEIRTKKSIRPFLFDPSIPFHYCWALGEDRDDECVQHVIELADGLYQLGRAVDIAWAWAEVMPGQDLDAMLRGYRGPVRHPAIGRGNVECPTPGSLASLMRRYQDMSRRYGPTSDGKGQTFKRRAKPKWQMISYDSAPQRECFDLIDRETSTFQPWPITQSIELVTTVRDSAVSRLESSLTDSRQEIHRALIGRKTNGENAGPISARVRIIPLPSIGHRYANQDIRRILVEVPSDCPLRADDVFWAFSGQELSVHGRRIDLMRAQAHRQLEHYGITTTGSLHWQTVTPIALTSATRRRVDPNEALQSRDISKNASEKRMEQELAHAAIRQSLRHAGVLSALRRVCLQREPFNSQGSKTVDFAVSPRFSHHALWHARLEFEKVVEGPLCLGDGRFAGLGILCPTQPLVAALAFRIATKLPTDIDPMVITKAFRRAVMARFRDHTCSSRLPTYITGHHEDSAPADRTFQPHVAYFCDPSSNSLLVMPPSAGNVDEQYFANDHKELEIALRGLEIVRVPGIGKLDVYSADLDTVSHLLEPSAIWRTLTPYTVCRHGKKMTAEEVIRRDVISECSRQGFPHPETIDVTSWRAQHGLGLHAELKLTFANEIRGPILLGRTRHKGGGVFHRVL